MNRYRLTTSGVCDTMVPCHDGPWVRFTDAQEEAPDLQHSYVKVGGLPHNFSWQKVIVLVMPTEECDHDFVDTFDQGGPSELCCILCGKIKN